MARGELAQTVLVDLKGSYRAGLGFEDSPADTPAMIIRLLPEVHPVEARSIRGSPEKQ